MQIAKKTFTAVISVIVTCYNQVDTLSQTLESVFSQICSFPFEVIIGDDCSDDDSLKICIEYKRRYGDRLTIIAHEHNVGVAKNWLACVLQAKGKYVAVCAADDYWHLPQKLQLQYDFMESNPSHGLLYTDFDALNTITGKVYKNYLKSRKIKIYEGVNLTKEFFEGNVRCLTLTVMFRKDLFDKYVPKEDFRNIFTIEDWPTWLILSKYTQIKYLELSTATYRFGHESLSNILDYENTISRYEAEHKMYQYLCERFPDDRKYDENEYVTYVDKILLSLAYNKNDFHKANYYSQKLSSANFRNNKVLIARHSFLFKSFNFFRKIGLSLNLIQP